MPLNIIEVEAHPAEWSPDGVSAAQEQHRQPIEHSLHLRTPDGSVGILNKDPQKCKNHFERSAIILQMECDRLGISLQKVDLHHGNVTISSNLLGYRRLISAMLPHQLLQAEVTRAPKTVHEQLTA